MFKISAGYTELPAIVNISSLTIDDVYKYMEYDAEVSITYNGSVFFCEEVAAIEFYWYLSRWYKAVTIGGDCEFVYSTVEHPSPILTFSPSGGNAWTIDSIWKKTSAPIVVDEPELLEQTRIFIDNIASNAEPV